MEIKTVKIERNYYIADDGKRFEYEANCIAYERRVLLGVKEIEDTTFLKLYLDIDKDRGNKRREILMNFIIIVFVD